MAKIKIEEYALNERFYNLPDDLTEFMVVINTAIAKIPGDLLHTARVEFDAEEYGGNFRINYFRDETDEEEATREANNAARARRSEQLERAKLAELLAKYGPASDTENRG